MEPESVVTVVFFRGNSTERIIEDARTYGVIPDGAKVEVLCMPGDRLARPGDIPYTEWLRGDQTILVCNGGTTRTLVPTLLWVRNVSNNYRLLDVQKDGIHVSSNTWTWDRPTPHEAGNPDCPCAWCHGNNV